MTVTAKPEAESSRPQTPQEWLKRYDAWLASGRGLTAREWDHYGALERTGQRVNQQEARRE